MPSERRTSTTVSGSNRISDWTRATQARFPLRREHVSIDVRFARAHESVGEIYIIDNLRRYHGENLRDRLPVDKEDRMEHFHEENVHCRV